MKKGAGACFSAQRRSKIYIHSNVARRFAICNARAGVAGHARRRASAPQSDASCSGDLLARPAGLLSTAVRSPWQVLAAAAVRAGVASTRLVRNEMTLPAIAAARCVIVTRVLLIVPVRLSSSARATRLLPSADSTACRSQSQLPLLFSSTCSSARCASLCVACRRLSCGISDAERCSVRTLTTPVVRFPSARRVAHKSATSVCSR